MLNPSDLLLTTLWFFLDAVAADITKKNRLTPSTSRDYTMNVDYDLHDQFNEDDNYWLEVKAIIGGVLGFWGGVGGLGTVFLVIVLSQRYCCKKDDDKDEEG